MSDQPWKPEYHVRMVLKKDTGDNLELIMSKELANGFTYTGSVGNFMIFANFSHSGQVLPVNGKIKMKVNPDGENSFIAEVIR